MACVVLMTGAEQRLKTSPSVRLIVHFERAARFETHHSTAHMAVMRLWTNDVEMFLHFHAFLRADSGTGSAPTPAFTSLKNPTEPPVVKITEPSSMARREEAGRRGGGCSFLGLATTAPLRVRRITESATFAERARVSSLRVWN